MDSTNKNFTIIYRGFQAFEAIRAGFQAQKSRVRIARPCKQTHHPVRFYIIDVSEPSHVIICDALYDDYKVYALKRQSLILYKVLPYGSLYCQLVAALVFGMSIMTLDPDEVDLVGLHGLKETLP